jgi:hypothetical protein
MPNYLLEVDEPSGDPGGHERCAFLMTANDVIPRVVGTGAGGQEGRDPRLYQREPGPKWPRKKASTAASAPKLCGADHGLHAGGGTRVVSQ